MELGTLQLLNPRDVFPTEPTHFSKWLAANLVQLGLALGLDLEMIKLEAAVGPFSLDILARVVGTDDIVIIENQMEQTDHGHLGQLLTYAAGYDAKYIVWVSPDFRERHRAALDWLNLNTTAARNFLGILVEVVRIDNSKPAVNFRPVVLPNGWQKTVSQSAHSVAARPDQEQLNEFFQAVRDRAHQSGAFERLLNPNVDRAYYVLERTHSGSIEYSAVFGRNQLRPEVALNSRRPGVNALLFDILKQRSEQIQAQVKGEITWDFQDPAKRQRQLLKIVRIIDRPNLAEHVEQLSEWVTDRLIELRRAIEPGLDAEITRAIAQAQIEANEDDSEEPEPQPTQTHS